jgi:hypothetical protein
LPRSSSDTTIVGGNFDATLTPRQVDDGVFGSQGFRLSTVDPSTDLFETDIGQLGGGLDSFRDIVIRSDGLLFGYQRVNATANTAAAARPGTVWSNHRRPRPDRRPAASDVPHNDQAKVKHYQWQKIRANQPQPGCPALTRQLNLVWVPRAAVDAW